MTYIASWSGGYDSSCMVVLILEKSLPLDYVVFTDTLSEFDEMYEYIDKFQAYIKRRFGKIVTIISPGTTLEEWAFTEVTRGKRKGKIRGLPLTTVPCYWKRESKVYPFDRWIKKEGIEDYKQYIGYTYSELQRAKLKAREDGTSLSDNQLYPLIDFKMTASDIKAFLKDRSIDNPLYKHFNRTGCYFCPKQGIEDFYLVWKHHPEKWEKIVEYEATAKKTGALNTQFSKHASFSEMIKMFMKKEKQSTFEFPDQHIEEEYCFCKF